MAASLKNVIEADDVGFDISIRMVNAIADASLGGEINDDVWFVLFEDFIDEFFIINHVVLLGLILDVKQLL